MEFKAHSSAIAHTEKLPLSPTLDNSLQAQPKTPWKNNPSNYHILPYLTLAPVYNQQVIRRHLSIILRDVTAHFPVLHKDWILLCCYHRNTHLHELQPTQSPSDLPGTYSPFIVHHSRQQLSPDRAEKLWCTGVQSPLEAMLSHCQKPFCSPWENILLSFPCPQLGTHCFKLFCCFLLTTQNCKLYRQTV